MRVGNLLSCLRHPEPPKEPPPMDSKPAKELEVQEPVLGAERGGLWLQFAAAISGQYCVWTSRHVGMLQFHRLRSFELVQPVQCFGFRETLRNSTFFQCFWGIHSDASLWLLYTVVPTWGTNMIGFWGSSVSRGLMSSRRCMNEKINKWGIEDLWWRPMLRIKFKSEGHFECKNWYVRYGAYLRFDGSLVMKFFRELSNASSVVFPVVHCTWCKLFCWTKIWSGFIEGFVVRIPVKSWNFDKRKLWYFFSRTFSVSLSLLLMIFWVSIICIEFILLRVRKLFLKKYQLWSFSGKPRNCFFSDLIYRRLIKRTIAGSLSRVPRGWVWEKVPPNIAPPPLRSLPKKVFF